MNKKQFSVAVLILSFSLSIALFLFRDSFRDAVSLGLFGIFLINFVSGATFFISGPAFLTVIAGGSIYPPILVALVASLGASFGDMVSFFFGYSGRSLAVHKLRKKLWFMVAESIFKTYGSFIILFLAILPNPIFDAVGIFAGIFGMNYKRFFLLMFVGRFARFVVLALIGARFY
jgi:membrane protein YqaA with SNARE-associated domain